MKSAEWRFDQPENAATITTRQVMREGFPILRVGHEEEDHSWSFTCGTTNDQADALVVGLGRILKLDPSLEELADLPPGWSASRVDASSPWTRHKPKKNNGGG